MDDRQVEPRFQRLELLAEGDRLPVLATVKQHDGSLVAAVGERADHAHHRRDADSAGDQHVHVRRIAVDGERTVRPIEIDALADRHLRQSRS